MYTKEEFVRVFVPHRRSVVALCQRMLSDSDEAEDACQAIYLNLWEQRERLPALEHALPYIIRTARNHCLDRLRRTQYTLPSSEEQLAEEVIDEDERERLEQKERLLAQLEMWSAALPEPQRTIFRSVHYESERAEAVAQRLGLSHGNVRVILSRLRKAAKEYLTTNDED